MTVVFRSLKSMLFLAAVSLWPGLNLSLSAQEWSRFRGPNGSGVLESGVLPEALEPEGNLEWKAEIGFARSSPILAGDQVLVTAMEGQRLLLTSLDLKDGTTRWTRTVEAERSEEIYQGNDLASPTPATDGTNFFVFFQPVGLLSFDAQGTERWRLPLGPFNNFYGVAVSPIVSAGRVILQCDQQTGSFIIAVDADTGQQVWRQDRPGRIDSYATPNLYPDSGSPNAVLALSSFALDAYDLASGEKLWEVGGLGYNPVGSGIVHQGTFYSSSPNHAANPADMPPPWSVVLGADQNQDGRLADTEAPPGPMQEHFGYADLDKDGFVTAQEYANMLEIMGTKNYGLVSVKLPTATGDEARINWRVTANLPYLSTSLLYRDVLYVFRDGGIVVSLDPETGKLLKRARFSPSAGEQFASAVAGDGKIYIAGHSGELGILQAGPQWEVLGVSDLGEEITATPALGSGRIYVRTQNHLWSFSAKQALRQQ